MAIQITDKRGDNGQEAPGASAVAVAEQIMSALSLSTTRAGMAAALGKSFANDARDIYTALGYTKTPNFNDSLKRYVRQDIAKRIINLPVKACWRKKPKITESKDEETAFLKDWETLVKDRRVWHYLSRVDRAASLGRFAVLLIGFDDTGELQEPVSKAGSVLYLMPYMEDAVQINTWVKDPSNERYELPELYSIQMASEGGTMSGSRQVHWSRVIHVAEDMLGSNVYGTPALEAILNRLEDLDRIAGGSAEMFWRGAFPGMALEADKDARLFGQDLDDLEDEMEKFKHGMTRYLRLVGMKAHNLAPQVADPSNHANLQIDLLAATRGIPKRILMGSERGELASTQDTEAFADEIDARRTEHCEPVILRPFIDRMIEVGVVSEPQEDYTVDWPDLLTKSDKDKADVGKTLTEMLVAYVNSLGADVVVPEEVFQEMFLGFDQNMRDRIKGIVQKKTLRDADGVGEEDEEEGEGED